MPLYVGTSGWAYPSWKPAFYPEKLAQKKFLNFYATKLNTVEVNFTFRQLVKETTIQNWLAETPEQFRFTIKAHQVLTHIKRLKASEEFLKRFLATLEPLERAKRLGPILFQLPPNFKADQSTLAEFLSIVPKGVRAAFEFRNATWFGETKPGETKSEVIKSEVIKPEVIKPGEIKPGEPAVSGAKKLPNKEGEQSGVLKKDGEATWQTLRARNAALCVAESEDRDTPDVLTADFAYYRYRKPTYTPEERQKMVARLREHLAEGRDVFAYFKHEETPEGALYAVDVLESVTGSSSLRALPVNE